MMQMLLSYIFTPRSDCVPHGAVTFQRALGSLITNQRLIKGVLAFFRVQLLRSL